MKIFPHIKIRIIALTYVIVLLFPFAFALYSYFKHPFFFETKNDYFSQIVLYVIQNIYFYIWLFLVFAIVKLHSFISFLKNVVLFFTDKNVQDTSIEQNDGYILRKDFGKNIFAYNILQVIDNFHKDEIRTKNLVIGLDGKWGDGKTFVLKEIQNILKKGIFPNFYQFSFQPWLFAKDTNYTNAFIDKLNTELIKLNCGINLIYLSAFKDMLNNTCGFWGRFISFFINKSDEELKSIIQKRINQTNKQFIVTIDDLDRLDTTEVLQIFKLVRCVANFENVYFILCLDRKVVESSIDEYFKQSSTIDDMTTHYCDKIINLYFEVPSIASEDLNILLDNTIDQDPILKVWKDTSDNYENMFRVLTWRFMPQNIREIKIIINKLKAISLFRYQSLEKKDESLSQDTDFYIFKILETIKLKNISLYNNIKNVVLWNSPFPNISDSGVRSEIGTLAQILKKSQVKHFYFAYNSGDLPISYEQYKLILANLSESSFAELNKNRYLASFFINAANDKKLSSEEFTKIVCLYEFQRECAKEFKILFNQKLPLLNIKEYFQQDYSSLTSLYTYDLINKIDNNEIRQAYINAYIETYNINKTCLPHNNLIFYIDFKNYTPQLFGLLLNKLFTKDIKESPGLLKLLNKFIEQTNGDTSLWDVDIIKEQCKLSFTTIINKLNNDYNRLEKLMQNGMDDSYYPNVKKAYELLIYFINNHKEDF